jgi:hypothetical protein
MNIADALDSYLSAKVQIGEWKQEFDAEFYEPLGKMLINLALESARKSPMIDQNKLEGMLSPSAKRKFRGE